MSRNAAARLAGFLYLLTNATAMFAFYARGKIMVGGDALKTAANMAASEPLFRAGMVMELVTVILVLLLVWALYVVLEPVNRNVALLAVCWRLAENFVLAVIVLAEFAALAILRKPSFDAGQLQTLWTALLQTYGAGFNIGFTFLGLGSAVFSGLWLQSRYIPRVLAAWGIFASAVIAVFSLAIMLSPRVASVGMAYMFPMGVYEFGLGFWLLFKGIRLDSMTSG
jgi:uncharacterized protein DUF4386